MSSGVRSLLLILSLVCATSLPAQSSLEDEAVQRMVEYLRINTTNPPGNEAQTMLFFARIFAKEGIPFDTASSAPGRGNIWARLKGGSAPAFVLLSHMDVVPADPRYWKHDPFGATVQDSEIFARGALDTKSLGVVELEAFLSLHRRHVPLARDVIFMATADEEAGGAFGAGWVVQHHPEAFRGAGILLNEGGDGTVVDGRTQVGIEVTQKVPLWLRLVSTGEPGHGSIPPVASSVNRLVRALDRLQTYQFTPRVVPVVDTYFKALAENAAPEWKQSFQNMEKAIADPRLLLRLQLEEPELAALLRNTCSITMLEASNKINVIPPEADARVDCRLLPDQDRQAFLAELATIINDPGIKIEQIMGFTAAVSPTDDALYRALVSVTHKYFPDANVVPQVSTGFTDSHYFRDLGINCYGYAPFVIPAGEQSGVHGNDERISIANVRRGTAIMQDIVDLVAGGH